jgi:hypothetical protein
MTPPGAIGARIVVTIVTGSIAFSLTLLLLTTAGLPVTIGTLAAALAGGGLIAAWLMQRAMSLRYTWGRSCLANGLLSAAVSVGFRVQDDLWVGRSQYVEDVDRAIGPLTHFVWALAARIGLVALILAMVLFALSYWLLGPPHRKA